LASSTLTVANIHAGYGAVRVLEDVSLNVGAGETVALLGTNGNGKSTLMKSIMGIVQPTSGSIRAVIDGREHELVGRSTEDIVDLGIGFVPEGRRLFPKLTVSQNLLLGAFPPRAARSRSSQCCSRAARAAS
jgi:branched-chain amino acid transport system ATP-binding protein